jgi:hypothetical protein
VAEGITDEEEAAVRIVIEEAVEVCEEELSAALWLVEAAALRLEEAAAGATDNEVAEVCVEERAVALWLVEAAVSWLEEIVGGIAAEEAAELCVEELAAELWLVEAATVGAELEDDVDAAALVLKIRISAIAQYLHLY